MRDVDLLDAVFVQGCKEFLDLLANYATGCDVLLKVEASGADTVEELACRLRVLRRQLSATLFGLCSILIHTPQAALARAAVIRKYLDEFPVEDALVLALLEAMIADAERLHGHSKEPSPDV